jgi:hypothetical protein
VATTARFVLRCIRPTARTVRAHLVTDDAAVAARRTRHYRAVCGSAWCWPPVSPPRSAGPAGPACNGGSAVSADTAGSLGGRGCRMRVAASPLIDATPRAQGGAEKGGMSVRGSGSGGGSGSGSDSGSSQIWVSSQSSSRGIVSGNGDRSRGMGRVAVRLSLVVGVRRSGPVCWSRRVPGNNTHSGGRFPRQGGPANERPARSEDASPRRPTRATGSPPASSRRMRRSPYGSTVRAR